ncbi:MAG: hypothetical protein KGL39_59525 [Patescibacteria group bacterium]|nr:hypothetical protein [Patescibacteria group bacterium]
MSDVYGRPISGPQPPQGRSFWDVAQQTWPVQLAQHLWGALKLPGDVYQGNVAITGADGRTNPEVINRAADLAGVLVGTPGTPADALGSGYKSVPDALMGFRKSGLNKGFSESNYPYTQYVHVDLGNGDGFVDAIKGMNQSHALERAARNWQAEKITPLSEAQARQADPSLFTGF